MKINNGIEKPDRKMKSSFGQTVYKEASTTINRKSLLLLFVGSGVLATPLYFVSLKVKRETAITVSLFLLAETARFELAGDRSLTDFEFYRSMVV